MDDCNHIWEPTDGEPNFRMNRQMSNVPIDHFRCRECNCRTWLTEEQWDALVIAATTDPERVDG